VNIAISDILLKTRLFGLHITPRIYWSIFNHFYVIGAKSYRILQNNANYMAITPFKVTDYGTNRKKPTCNFLLLINSNLPHILHILRFQAMADYWSNFCQR